MCFYVNSTHNLSSLISHITHDSVLYLTACVAPALTSVSHLTEKYPQHSTALSKGVTALM